MTQPERNEAALPMAFVSTYVPRRCGLATFTRDLSTAVRESSGAGADGCGPQVLAITETGANYEYGREVVFEIRRGYRTDYRQAADFLNVSPVEVVSLQHEFGIFGGEDGSHVLALLGNLKKPVVTTLHTVLTEPSDGQHRTLREVCQLSAQVVVMSRRAERMLAEVYGVPADKIAMIPHGVPDVPLAEPAFYRDRFQLEGSPMVLTFGLLGPNKGIEVAINAMADVVSEFPDAVYVVLGATHPEVVKNEGEAYRVGLEQQVARLGLAEHVVFRKRYVSFEELRQFLLAADYYVTPYLNREQITSGTLAYAVGCGKAVLSTPYWYAQELLADGRGVLFDFGDSAALARSLRELMRDPVQRDQMRKRAYLFGRDMIWPAVAARYAEVCRLARSTFGRQQRRAALRSVPIPEPAVPEVRLDHLRVLTDGTGVLQHAVFATPDREHGYCTDDNARGLVVLADNWRLLADRALLPLMQTCLAFLDHAFHAAKGRFRNFMSYEREWLEEVGSEDCHGRAMWALGELVRAAPTQSVLGMAKRLFEQAMPAAAQFSSPRAWAFVIMGLDGYLSRFSRAREPHLLAGELTVKLYRQLQSNSGQDWPWFEDAVCYCNARLPHALLLGGRHVEQPPIVQAALRSLDWLFEVQTAGRKSLSQKALVGPRSSEAASGKAEEGGDSMERVVDRRERSQPPPQPTEARGPSGIGSKNRLSLIGNEGWLPRGGTKAEYDQQPIEAACLIQAAHQAYRITGDRLWVSRMRLCMSWFLGSNDLSEPVYDFQTAGCHDGLHAGGVNENQGAESTLAYLMTVQSMHLLDREDTLEALAAEPRPQARPEPKSPDTAPVPAT